MLSSLLADEARERLKQLRASIFEELERRTEEAAARKAAIERRAEERAEAEALRKQMKARQAAEAKAKLLAQNEAIDTVFLAIGKGSASGRQELSGSILLALRSAKEPLPPELASSAAWLARTAKLPSPFPEVFILACDTALKGLPFPGSGAGTGYVVDSCDSKRLRLVYEEDKAKIFKKIDWDRLSSAEVEALLRQRLLAKPEALAALPLQMKESLLAELLLFSEPELFQQTLAAASPSPSDMDAWNACARLLAESKAEAEAASLWREANASSARGKREDSLQMFKKLSSEPRFASFAKRYAPLINEAIEMASQSPTRRSKAPAQ